MEKLAELLNQYKWPILLSILGLVLVIGGVNLKQPQKAQVYQDQLPQVQGAKVSSIKVDVSGAVVTPGVYSLNSTSRVEDAIQLSGGFLPNAHKEYISKILNLSQKISDGQKIYIPFQSEKSVPVALSGFSGTSTGKVGLNSGTQSELESLPSIGVVSAQKIIASRPYNEIYDLVSKKVISKTTFDKIKDLIDQH